MINVATIIVIVMVMNNTAPTLVAMITGTATEEVQLCHLLLIAVDITMNHAAPATAPTAVTMITGTATEEVQLCHLLRNVKITAPRVITTKMLGEQ